MTRLAALIATLTFASCRVADAPRPDSAPRGSGPPPALSSPAVAAACEPSACPAYCQAAACLFSSAARCQELCRARCGDAYFEPADAEVMACTGAATTCDVVQRCCMSHFTSHLCGE